MDREPPEPAPTIRDRQTALIDAERLTMQTVQTALSLIGFGFTINAFFDDHSGAGVAARRLGLGMLTLGMVFLAMTALPMLIIAAAIKLTSKGPVLFKQPRHGENGVEFNVLKFRSMSVMEKGANVQQAQRNDPRITKLGAFLRRSSLDELPQFLNVIMGNMSLVGPRPHAIAHNALYRTKILEYMRRHKVKPGITGWAQVNGWRGETDTVEQIRKRVEHDLYYIENWSILLDLKIIVRTILGGFAGAHAF